MIVLLLSCSRFAAAPPEQEIDAYTSIGEDGTLLHIHGRRHSDEALPRPPSGGRLHELTVTTLEGASIEVGRVSEDVEGLTIELGPIEPGRLSLRGTYEFPDGTTATIAEDVFVHSRRP